MKKIGTLILLIFSSIAFTQIPTGYYDTAIGTGYTLKTQLKNIISIDNIVSGSTGYGNLYTTYQTSDIDNFYENDGTILDMYSEKPSGSDPYNFSKDATQRCGNYTAEGDCYNREHIIPQSVFNELSPMKNDAHFITPTDGKVNGYRSNYPHGMVGTLDVPSSTGITNPTANGSKLGNGLNSGYATGYTGIVFEPIDEFKGDIARMYFYFATKYQDQLTTWGKPYPMFDGSTNKVFTTTFLNILLAWNTLDPVSNREIARNNAIYTNQGNRNPYIDHPEYVNSVWSTTTTPDTENPTVATNLTATGATSSTVSLSWTAATDNVGIASYTIYVDGVLKDTTTGLTKTITGLTASTTYSFYVIAKDFSGNSSPASTSVNKTTTTTTVGGSSKDLFFSEYLEGTSLNKALEIVNLTGDPVDLSIYSLKKQSNGAGAWLATNPLSGTLANGAVYVAVDNGIATSCYALTSANVSYPGATSSSPTSFNGNDAVGLFKNNILIDVIGTYGVATDFAKDQTLRRKSTVTSPNATFDKALEWDVFPVNTCDNIGTYDVATLSNVTFNSDDIKILPNPSNGNFTINFNDLNNLYSVQIYSLTGQKVFEKEKINVPTTTINQIKSGIYFVKINQDSKSFIKKIQVQ
jgi:endonuclease I